MKGRRLSRSIAGWLHMCVINQNHMFLSFFNQSLTNQLLIRILREQIWYTKQNTTPQEYGPQLLI